MLFKTLLNKTIKIIKKKKNQTLLLVGKRRGQKEFKQLF